MRRTGLGLALAAVAVNAPRLVLAFLEADGVAVAPGLRAGLLGLTGVATGVVLTGGAAFLAHAAARDAERRRLLLGIWLLVVTCAAALVAPELVAGLSRSRLPEVLPAPAWRWLWAALAVVAVELVAAGCMAAQGSRAREGEEAEELRQRLFELAEERNRLREQLLAASRGRSGGKRRAGGSKSAPGSSRLAREPAALASPALEPMALASSGSPSTSGSASASEEPATPPSGSAPTRDLASSSGSASSLASVASASSLASASAGRVLTGVRSEELFPCRHGCGWVGSSKMAENGHQRGCPAREVDG